MHTALALIAAAILAQAAAPSPQTDDPADYVKQARRLVADGAHDEALALYEKAIAAQPSSFEAHLGAGIVLDLKLQFADARMHLTKALEFAPDEAKAQVMNALAVSYAFEGNAKESASFYQKTFDQEMAESNFGAAAGTANALGRVYLETGDVANARRWYQTGYESARRQADATTAELTLWEFRWLHAQGRIAARAGQLDDAHKAVSAARALLDRTRRSRTRRHRGTTSPDTWSSTQKITRTRSKSCNRRPPDDPFVLSLLARAYEGAGEADRARETWAKVLEFNGHSLQNAFARPMAVQKVG